MGEPALGRPVRGPGVTADVLVRDVQVPVPGHHDVRLAVVTLDTTAGTSRPPLLDPGRLAALERAVESIAERADLDGVAITGGTSVFCAGADLTWVRSLKSREDGLELGGAGQRVFGRLADLAVPTFAFVNGAAIGGGLELALHCDHRTAVSTVRRISLPEVTLGLVPGWGGTWLLPHLVGPDHAVTLAVTNPLARNRQLDAAEALRVGLVDAVVDPADFVADSLRWAASVIRGRTTVTRPTARRDPGAWRVAVERGRADAEERLHGAAPAPTLALDLIEAARTRSRTECVAAERDALATLVTTPQTQAALYAAELLRTRPGQQRVDSSDARPVRSVGVVGAGLMARQVAAVVAERMGVPVAIVDQHADGARGGLAAVHASIDDRARRGRISADRATRLRAQITASDDWAKLADCDLVIEAVVEELDVKRDVLQRIDQVVRPDCVVATNTSALSIGGIAERSGYPERFLGLHFFNPVAAMPLVEVVTTTSTGDVALATAMTVATALGKTAVPCADSPGFVVNRLLSAFIDASVTAVDHGTPIDDVEQAALELGLPMGPFALIDLVGAAVALHVGETMHAAFPTRYSDSPTLRTLAAGAVVEPGQGTVLSPTDLQDRLLRAVAVEVRELLDARVVTDAREIDLAMLLGAGWPAHLGGVTPELRRRGLLG